MLHQNSIPNLGKNRTASRSPKLTTLLCLLVSSAFFALAGTAENCSAQKPNIILINLDDADTEMFEVRNSQTLYRNITAVTKTGTTFTNLHATTPLCGPSRACLYRAQYAHNTGIRINDPAVPSSHGFNGGFAHYAEQGFFENDLSTWMKDAGYRTMMIGKFLHPDFSPIVPPGWDDFHSYLGGSYYQTHRFSNEEVPEGRVDRIEPGLYRTTEETRDAIRTIERHVARRDGRPFFLNINPYGPHTHSAGSPGMVDTRMLTWWPTIRMPRSLSHNEADISDKRGYFRGLLPLEPWQVQFTEARFRDRALALRSCDDMLGAIQATLDRLELADNTYIMITSDNGYLNGHHRAIGKGTPVNRSTNVPLYVIGPGVPAGRKANHLIAHIDIGPTIVNLAGREAPDFVDGRSFAHLLRPNGIDDHPVFRNGILIENWAQYRPFGQTTESASTTLRTEDWIYTEWANGEKDFFDLQENPDQLHNNFSGLHEITRDFFATWLRSLKNPNQKSKARFSVPFEEGELIPAGQGLRGLAEDAVGVEHVRLAVYDVEGKRYWNGSDWQSSFFLLTADLENPGGQITFWNYNAMPDETQVAPGSMTAWVWSYDRQFRHDSPTVAFFRN